jgi:hypothetical protein
LVDVTAPPATDVIEFPVVESKTVTALMTALPFVPDVGAITRVTFTDLANGGRFGTFSESRKTIVELVMLEAPMGVKKDVVALLLIVPRRPDRAAPAI